MFGLAAELHWRFVTASNANERMVALKFIRNGQCEMLGGPSVS